MPYNVEVQCYNTQGWRGPDAIGELSKQESEDHLFRHNNHWVMVE